MVHCLERRLLYFNCDFAVARVCASVFCRFPALVVLDVGWSVVCDCGISWSYPAAFNSQRCNMKC